MKSIIGKIVMPAILLAIATAIRLAAASAESTGYSAKVWVQDFEASAQKRLHVIFFNEDVVGAGQWGLGGERVTPLIPDATVNGVVRTLRKDLPAYKIWRDRIDHSFIHVVNRRVLLLKTNPLSRRFSFHGTTSLIGLEKNLLVKTFPMVHFHNYSSGGHVIPYFPRLAAFHVPIKLSLKNITLRRFLSTRIPNVKSGGRRWLWSWSANYRFQKGKLTGQVQLIIFAIPETLGADRDNAGRKGVTAK